MPTKAAELFISRESEGVKDNRTFDGWYHIDDHRYVLWKKYNQLSDAVKAEVLPPYVIMDFEHSKAFTLADKLSPIIEFLAKCSQKYQPFIVKAEISQSHYVGGFLRKDAGGKITIAIFNPVGKGLRIDNGNIGTDKNIEIIFSNKKIQTTEKDNKRLSSCGPLSLAFVDYAMSNPEYMRTLDKQFNLPASLNIEGSDKAHYKKFVLALRQQHYEVLDTVSDKDEPKVRVYDSAVSEAFFDYHDKKNEQEKAKRDAELTAAANANGQGVYEDNWDDSGADAVTDSEVPWDDSVDEDSDTHPVVAKPQAPATSVVVVIKPVASGVVAKPIVSNAPTAEVAKPSAVDPEQRADVLFIRSQIKRFEENAKSLFSINNKQKADAIKSALNSALHRDVSDVRLDAGVKNALAKHRIFGFFGYKTTTATDLNEESLSTKPIK